MLSSLWSSPPKLPISAHIFLFRAWFPMRTLSGNMADGAGIRRFGETSAGARVDDQRASTEKTAVHSDEVEPRVLSPLPSQGRTVTMTKHSPWQHRETLPPDKKVSTPDGQLRGLLHQGDTSCRSRRTLKLLAATQDKARCDALSQIADSQVWQSRWPGKRGGTFSTSATEARPTRLNSSGLLGPMSPGTFSPTK